MNGFLSAAPVWAVGPTSTKDTNEESTLLEPQPVNTHEARQDQINTARRSAAMLAAYKTVSRNTRTRLFRRYYDKWLMYIAVPKIIPALSAALSRETRATQTEPACNGDVEVYEGGLFGTPPRAAPSAAREVILGVDDDMNDSLSDLSNTSTPSPSPVKPPAPCGPQPAFQFSPAPPLTSGIAATSRPAKHLTDVNKPDLPRRKGASPSRAGPSVGLPTVVADPVRVYRQ